MEPFAVTFVLFMIGIVIIAIVGFLVQQQKNEERQQAFSKLAAGAGLQFISEDDSYGKRFNDGEKPFRMMGGGRVRNIL